MARHQEQQIAISDYREFRPPSALAEYLLCFWTQTISPSSEFTQRVLPDCCVDIILMNEVPMVIGPWTEPFDANLPAGTNVLGVRCHPGLASSLLGVPASELLNLSVPLCDYGAAVELLRLHELATKSLLPHGCRQWKRPCSRALRKPVRSISRQRQGFNGLPGIRMDELNN